MRRGDYHVWISRSDHHGSQHECRDLGDPSEPLQQADLSLLTTTDLGKVMAVVDALRGSSLLNLIKGALTLSEDEPSEEIDAYGSTIAAYQCSFAMDMSSISDPLACGIDLNIRDGDWDILLLKATRACHEEFVCRLAIEGKGRVELECQDARGGTPLRYALILQSKDMCKVLLDHGASPEAVHIEL